MTIDELITLAIREDIGDGDHTSLACISLEAEGKAKLLVKEEGIIAGVEAAEKVLYHIDKNLDIDVFIKDGTPVKPGDIAFHVSGKSCSILKAERLMLNILQRMSGVATYTNSLTKLIEAYPAKILDTRKTTPNFRMFEKWAVKIGGGENHRMGLFDMIMLKDNHIDFAGGIEKAILAVQLYLKEHCRQLKIEVEARNLDEVREIMRVGGIHRIMLDNFSIEDMLTAVQMIGKEYETEASGGISEDTIAEIASTGVDYISVGAITHRIKSLDMSLKAF
ncbi:MAG: carboxylating nicotinate-nucleotide diphosphorylase [Bacteroidetes bacterium]|nr:carboxylating nicotinate-nucleotide diphosphorylase [Bacteroidota bacterium]MBU1720909.1 carboxylating nicotinate-nucleotide diphosphorylase [Bacteroidota bacterium]